MRELRIRDVRDAIALKPSTSPVKLVGADGSLEDLEIEDSDIVLVFKKVEEVPHASR